MHNLKEANRSSGSRGGAKQHRAWIAEIHGLGCGNAFTSMNVKRQLKAVWGQCSPWTHVSGGRLSPVAAHPQLMGSPFESGVRAMSTQVIGTWVLFSVRHKEQKVALSPHENKIIAAILALAGELPRPLTCREYTQALGEMRRNAFRVPGRSRGEITKGYMDGHQIRATDPQWKGMK